MTAIHVFSSGRLIGAALIVISLASPARSQQQTPAATEPAQQTPPATEPAAQEPATRPQRPGRPAPPPPGPLVSAGVTAARSMQPGRAFERPFRGLFGGSQIGPGSPGLFLTIDAYGTLDRADDSLRAQLRDARQASHGGAAALLDYMRPGDRLFLGVSGMTDARKYESLDKPSLTHDWRVNGRVNAGRTALRFNQGVSYAPLFRYALLPGQELPGDTAALTTDADLTEQSRFTTISGAGFTRQIRRRSSLSGGYDFRRSKGIDVEFESVVHSANIGYEMPAGRYSTLRLGYDLRQSEYDDDDGPRITRVNSLDLGGSYVRPLSFSRRTTLGVSGGSSRYSTEGGVAGGDAAATRLTGTATLAHELARTWTIRGNFTRGVQFADIFPDPFFVNSARLSVGGLLSRRAELTLMGIFSDGRLRLTTAGNQYRSALQRTTFGWAFSERLRMSAQYGFSWYDFGQTAGLPFGLSNVSKRHSVTLRGSYWIPLHATR
jgi:hypothetical protein